MNTHEENGPSSLHRRIACLGSRAAERGLPNTSSKASEEGDEAHSLLEHLLNGHPLGGDESPDMLPHVMTVVNWVNKWVEKGYALYSEKRVDPSYILGPNTAGTADIILVKDEHVVIADFKYGHRDVSVIENPQLLAYAAGAACDGDIVNLEDEITTPRYTLVILQPRLFRGATVKTTELSELEISQLWGDLQAKLKEVNDDSPRSASDDACAFCRARMDCPERFTRSQEISTDIINIVDEPSEGDKVLTDHASGISGLSPETIAALLDLKPFLDAVYEDIAELAFDKAKAGEKIPGFKIIEGPGRRKWQLTEEELARKWKSLKIPMADYLVSKMASPAQIEKLEVVKGLSEKQRDNIKRFYTKSAGKPVLVPSTVSGTEVIFDSGTAFAAAGITPAPIEPISFL